MVCHFGPRYMCSPLDSVQIAHNIDETKKQSKWSIGIHKNRKFPLGPNDWELAQKFCNSHCKKDQKI